MTFNTQGWNNAYKLTIDSSKVEEDLTDFPVSIVLSSGTGQSGLDVSDIFDELTVSGSSYTNRKKIAITTTISGVETELYTEIANWSHADEEASLWTKIPTIASGTDTELFLYYDATQSGTSGYVGDTGDAPAQNVWDNAFTSVWHMEQDPSGGAGCVLDSTSNNRHGTPTGMLTSNLVDGKVGKALDFDGSNDEVNRSSGLVYGDATHTVSASVYIDSVKSSRVGLLDLYPQGNRGHHWLITSNTTSLLMGIWGVQGLGSSSLGTSTWANVVSVYDSVTSIYSIYVNGVLDNSANFGSNYFALTGGAVIGEGVVGELRFDGKVDETCISSEARSPSWVKASHYSVSDDLIAFSPSTVFVFLNPFPPDSSTAYNTSKDLMITVTVTGINTYSTYDAEFYDSLDDSQISSTVSGVSNSAQASVYMPTPSGIEYGWYVKATSSGHDSTSDTYTFDNRFLCHGWVEDQGARASGIPVRLYRRSTGELVGTATTTGIDGSFDIESEFNEYHYTTALYDSSDTNALIYDWVIPE